LSVATGGTAKMCAQGIVSITIYVLAAEEFWIEFRENMYNGQKSRKIRKYTSFVSGRSFSLIFS